MSGPFPHIEPYESGMLDGGDGHQVYWECCGNPAGKPALYLHGGPGSGCSAGPIRGYSGAARLIILIVFDLRRPFRKIEPIVRCRRR
jgi:proline iminopeptidase